MQIKTNILFVLVGITFFSCNSLKQTSDSIIYNRNELYPPSNLVFEKHTEWTKKHYPERIEEFRNNPLEKGEVVFIGNSLTEQGKDWERHFNEITVKNRGISGDISEGVLHRLNEICFYKPESLFLLIGINDLFNGTISNDEIVSNIQKIVAFVNQNSPKTRIYVQSLLPTSHENMVRRIADINEKLKNKERTAGYEFIDVHQLFATKEDLMIKKFTTDGTHLNESGYEHWAKHLKKYVEK
ncbi:GDSL-type esterase/lipase family protein [Marinilabilia rubra]|uniref:GDSL family lipase n=1 Tax=Marinilabilia rubra TaxID=2162893 RepID=A0A2U2BC21_9BACT|nr:GDSL-type esterase/lipase family protein [Marinilabilia rubra]PWE00616.1 GDSL family lipase [Marinilabilia rubra]